MRFQHPNASVSDLPARLALLPKPDHFFPIKNPAWPTMWDVPSGIALNRLPYLARV
jgi:hypothetical protein